jgi:hypothetical protein
MACALSQVGRVFSQAYGIPCGALPTPRRLVCSPSSLALGALRTHTLLSLPPAAMAALNGPFTLHLPPALLAPGTGLLGLPTALTAVRRLGVYGKGSQAALCLWIGLHVNLPLMAWQQWCVRWVMAEALNAGVTRLILDQVSKGVGSRLQHLRVKGLERHSCSCSHCASHH